MSDSNLLLRERLQAVEAADSAQGLLDSVEALAALADEGAIDTLIQVLGYNNPGAAVAAVDGLIKIGTPAASALLTQIDGYNYGARAWALRVLAGIGDPRGLDLILETAVEDFSLSVRRAAARGLGAIQWEKLPEEKRKEEQARTLQTLLKVVEDVEWVVRYGAVVGLQGVAIALIQAGAFELTDPVVTGLQERHQKDDILAVQARARWALMQIQSFDQTDS
ncbi:HEAT repeat domain-containing protein [cf. Phormidesmis sp. LEGE 11477]|uniref:HEAT repeat domain-containing protein n=1 Tax=cf. Phormidesmis sp. LEGE 11477 TaxID=1828680 RepID=UPI00187F28F6|nr:HEAT repeat domain-containing protein [cf. Phormidesmis sp. LEGE 11477]MBE9060229.1 HEAT repeat domain-containing protein [cf. Phormidesmis sp. LEGE 11477]